MYLFGLDWSEEKHDVCIMTEKGRQLAAFSIKHEPAGLERLEEVRQRLSAPVEECLVALETAHSLVVDWLWDHHYTTYVIPPKATNRYRDRHRASRSQSDSGDAAVLAHILRTDRHLYTPWLPDQPLTRRIRALVRHVDQLARHERRLGNQLRAVLLRYYPQAATLFSGLTIPISLSFIQAYPTPEVARALNYEDFKTFCRQHHHSQPKHWPKVYAKLDKATLSPDPVVVQMYADHAVTLATLALSVVQARHQGEKQMGQLFTQHPDHNVFASLPGAGAFLAPALLAKFGDRRERFPDPSIVQAFAGTCPVTVGSGKKRAVFFRRACDKEFRHIAQQFARYSVAQSVWAAGYFQEIRPRCDSDSHAYRCLANRWLAIIWKMWQDSKPYDETYHLQQCARRRSPRS